MLLAEQYFEIIIHALVEKKIKIIANIYFFHGKIRINIKKIGEKNVEDKKI